MSAGKCAAPTCAPGEHLVYEAGACGAICVCDDPSAPEVAPGDCACFGGHLDAETCGVFGAPWLWDADEGACVVSGLDAEQCRAVEHKHAGDGSGSDVYNLGLVCAFGM